MKPLATAEAFPRALGAYLGAHYPATPDFVQYAAGLDRAISRGWLEIHDSGTYVKFNGGRR
jgi:hypothetical protein